MLEQHFSHASAGSRESLYPSCLFYLHWHERGLLHVRGLRTWVRLGSACYGMGGKVIFFCPWEEAVSRLICSSDSIRSQSFLCSLVNNCSFCFKGAFVSWLCWLKRSRLGIGTALSRCSLETEDRHPRGWVGPGADRCGCRPVSLSGVCSSTVASSHHSLLHREPKPPETPRMSSD